MSEKNTLANQIYRQMKEDISNKVYQPGEKLNIKELSRKYDVSDTPVKQALLRLEEDKLVVNVPNKGMSVRAVSLEEMDDIFALRMMMDSYFIKDIISTLSFNETIRQQLLENLQAQKDYIADEAARADRELFYQLDLQFHTLYLSCVGNSKLLELSRAMNPFMYTAYQYMQQSHVRDEECVAEHEEILTAALQKDEERLKNALQAHILRSKRAVHLIFKVNQLL